MPCTAEEEAGGQHSGAGPPAAVGALEHAGAPSGSDGPPAFNRCARWRGCAALPGAGGCGAFSILFKACCGVLQGCWLSGVPARLGRARPPCGPRTLASVQRMHPTTIGALLPLPFQTHTHARAHARVHTRRAILRAAPLALQRRAAKQWLEAVGGLRGRVTFAKVEAVLGLLHAPNQAATETLAYVPAPAPAAAQHHSHAPHAQPPTPAPSHHRARRQEQRGARVAAHVCGELVVIDVIGVQQGGGACSGSGGASPAATSAASTSSDDERDQEEPLGPRWGAVVVPAALGAQDERSVGSCSGGGAHHAAAAAAAAGG